MAARVPWVVAVVLLGIRAAGGAIEGGQVDEAIVALREVLARRPADGEAHAALGLLLEGARRWDDAEAAHRAALRVPALAAVASQRLGALLLQRGGAARADEAVQLLADAARAQPEDASLASALGAALAAAGRPRDAAGAFARAHALQPGSAERARLAALAASEAAAADPADALRLLADAESFFVHAVHALPDCAADGALRTRDEDADAVVEDAAAVRLWTDLGIHLRRLGTVDASLRPAAAATAAASAARLGAVAALCHAAALEQRVLAAGRASHPPPTAGARPPVAAGHARVLLSSVLGDGGGARHGTPHAGAPPLLGQSYVNTLDVGYVRRLFEQEAVSFDESLVHALAYRGPQLLARAVDVALGGAPTASRARDRPLLAILDLGCGTGLSGEPFRSFASWLVGIDLSPTMADFARAREVGVVGEAGEAGVAGAVGEAGAAGASGGEGGGAPSAVRRVYDEVGVGELRACLAHLRAAADGAHDGVGVGGAAAGGAGRRCALARDAPGRPPAFDVALLSDVIGYVGELKPLLSAVRAVLRPGSGLLALTAEKLPDTAALPDTTPADGEAVGGAAVGGVALLDSGRFGHSQRYLHAAAHASGFDVVSSEEAVLRTNRGQPVAAIVLVLRAGKPVPELP
ncbi:hypothetical protein KFE25_006609 [Diacronema lutheri]|uniref:Methyltransferase type 11 domain-containing protein n=2 Tax=Diacronema lutheri TaxID=2081491 RepID=A0A8J6BZG4_DIALT|nr:hypothetical protein KFE25_006609 [Diacronema lutheri]